MCLARPRRRSEQGYAVFADHVYTPTLLQTHSAQLFDWIARGVLKVRIGGTYPLAEASRAHADMESRTTTGKLLLIPSLRSQ